MTINPLFNISGRNSPQFNWVKKYLPDNYENYTYVEPFCGSANTLLNKDRSALEAINDFDLGTIQILRALRDEPAEFIRKIKNIKFCEETFLTACSKDNFNNYMEQAINEYVLIKMSYNGLKKTFFKRQDREEIWNDALKELSAISKRLNLVYIFNANPIEIIQTFNNKNTLILCRPEEIYNNSHMKMEDHEELSISLHKHKGKIIVINTASPLYNKMYKNWDSYSKTVGKRKEVLWKNF